MPELPEAHTIATQLDRCLRGARLTNVRVRLAKIARGGGRSLAKALGGRTVRCVTRRGKRVVLHLEPAGVLVIRLGMTGQVIVTTADAPGDRHVHLRIGLEHSDLPGGELRFRDVRRFGSVWFTDGVTDHDAAGIDDLGPEPLELRWAEFNRLLDRRRQIKALLLDQRTIAGLGNIYCDESLYAARVHPLMPAAEIPVEQRRVLYRAIRRILREAIRFGGSTLRDFRGATGDEGRFQVRWRVYGHEGDACYRCGTPIERIAAAGRSTHVCPNCQPWT